MIEVLLILGALGLVVACGAFVAAEFSFVTVDRGSVDRAVEAGDRGARGVQSALRTLSTQLSSAQVGITVTNLLIGYMAEPSIARLIDGPLESAGVPEDVVPGVALAIALILATGITMVFGELVPKNLAIARPLATAQAVQGFLRGFTGAARPIVFAFNNTANAILRRIGIEPQEELASARSAEELASLVRRSAEQGTLETGTAALLQRSLAFGERTAHEIMTPRGRVVTVSEDDHVTAVTEAARESGRSRFPVLGENGAITGIVHVKHAVAVPFERRSEVRVNEVMSDPVLVPASLELDDLLDQLRAGGLQMALVVDEFGNVDGLVTLEDLVEEIVGEVRDEHDEGEQRARREGDANWVLSGLLRPDEVQQLVGVKLPEDDDYETIAGLIGDELARMPAEGDAVTVRAGDQVVTLTVLAMDDLRVDVVRLTHEPIADAEDAA
ncbi:HlyC/CorC family transporter [Solirubrobacter sp. CPCC 204708]|uniref:Hemolysin family protein n=1 Tax=Solirubrobacter deserti TaxID=2282478 RepID=A0ABT4RVC1_9ACTN|nr:hemolysin family protein [Solirubrobacter deserti]MBE2319335.1 HlyC/CorC family transporter [Solirubrobacter deserti]MDA0142303.1 hemolysin family protein [Solirubrobacter deserti]